MSILNQSGRRRCGEGERTKCEWVVSKPHCFFIDFSNKFIYGFELATNIHANNLIGRWVFPLFFLFGSSIYSQKSFRLLCPRKRVEKNDDEDDNNSNSQMENGREKKLRTFIFERLFPATKNRYPSIQYSSGLEHRHWTNGMEYTRVYAIRSKVHGARRLWFVFYFI